MMKRTACTLMFCCLIVGNTFAFDMMTSKGLGTGRTVMLSQATATDLLSVPSGGIKPHDWSFEGGYLRSFGLSDLDRLFFAGATRRGRVGIAIGASQFGKPNLYAEQVLKGVLTYQYRALTFGGTLSAMQVQFGGDYASLRAVTVGGALSIRTKRLLGALTADNLTSPSLIDGAPVIEPKYSAYAELIGLGSYSILARSTFEKYQKPQFAIGQVWKVAEQASLFWGVSTQPMEYGGGLELRIGRTVFTYAVSIHPVLEMSHLVTIGYGTAQGSAKRKSEFE